MSESEEPHGRPPDRQPAYRTIPDGVPGGHGASLDAVRGAVDDLDTIADAEIETHVQRYRDVHQCLQDALDAADEPANAVPEGRSPGSVPPQPAG